MTSLNHQEIRVVSADDTIQILSKLKEAKSKISKQVESVAVALALPQTFAEAQETSLVTMFQNISRCFPKLKSLDIWSEVESESCQVPIAGLTALLHPNKGPKQLKVLTLQGVRFSGDDKAYSTLVKAIGKHSALECCELYETSMNNLSTGESGMEKIISALSKKLKKIEINGSRLAPSGAPYWSGTSLVELCHSPTLAEIKLHNIRELGDEHIVLMAQTLERNKVLRKLSLLKCEEEPLKKNKKTKRKNSKKAKEAPVEAVSSEAGALSLANMLRINTTLEELSLSAMDFNEYCSMFFGNALETDNTTLQSVWLLVPTNDGGTSSFPPDDPRIDYFLRLNRAGRQKVTSLLTQDREQGDDKSRPVWVESLIHAKRDVNVSFFFLSVKPSLCQVR